MASATGLTIDDFERLPQALADNHELVDGELIKMSGNTPQHNLFRDFLTSLLRSYVREHQLGRIISEQEFDFGGNAHGPDISFISQAQCSLINMKVRVQRFVPDLANGGNVAETKTAAKFWTRIEEAGTLTPIRSSVAASVWIGKVVCWLSPVPCRPTTIP